MDVKSGLDWLEKTVLQSHGHPISILSNLAAFIATELERLKVPCNWCGFYILTKSGADLLLGPFAKGKPACVRLKVKNASPVGVCAYGIISNKTQVVDNVHDFPGHIACDDASKSELVIPVRAGNLPIAVLDIDSPVLSGFSSQELVASIQQLIDYLEDNENDIKWASLRSSMS